jgi:hypothetical protein
MGRFVRWGLALAIAVLLMAACTESGLKAAPTAIPGSTETESALDDPYDSITGDIAYSMFGAYSALPAFLTRGSVPARLPGNSTVKRNRCWGYPSTATIGPIRSLTAVFMRSLTM